MQIVTREQFNHSADEIWHTISDFGGLGRYFAPVVQCKLDGSGVGARRIVTLRTSSGEEAIVIEKLESLDPSLKTLSYSIADATGFPIKDGYVGTMIVTALGDKKCELEWTATVENPEGVSEQVTRDFIQSVYGTGFAGLRDLYGG